MSGRPTNLDNSRAGAYCACSICWWGLFGHCFLLYFYAPRNEMAERHIEFTLSVCVGGVCVCVFVFVYFRIVSRP